MKRIMALLLAAVLVVASYIIADQRTPQKTTAPSKTSSQKNTQVKKTTSTNQPVIINMNRPSSGGHNQNFPTQQKQENVKPQEKQSPVYGKLQLTPSNKGVKPVKPAGNIASAVHHHPYEPNYVRKKLQKLGVTSAPGYIVNREEVIHTDREHSIIAYPKAGFDNRPISAVAFSSRHFNDQAIRAHMSLVGSSEWLDRIRAFNQSENRPNFYYWHNDKNFTYCHFIDNSGYHWYGWYLGNKYFWIRNFNNRWWWYDVDYDRWCFWNNGFWWWQDPYHMGDLYCYNDASYIPCNSAEDNVAVIVPDNNNTHNYTSPDGTRIVKVVADTEDAFLYDSANPPSFNPVYLASGVQDVMYSDPKNGRPLEIILKLNDQSFDMFDGNGNSYNPGQTAQ